MFHAIKQDDKYILKFKYDPALITIVKAVPGRQWNPQQKYWSIPVSHLGWLIKGIKDTPYEKALQIVSDENINENATLDSTQKIPDVDISDIDYYVKDGFHLYQHQVDFLKYAKNKGQKGFILADDMGCGKTLEILNFALYQRKRYRYKHCLIITCVNSAKYSWQEDIDKHTNGLEQAYILGTRVIKRGKRKGQLRYNGSGQDKVDDLITGHMYGDVNAPELPYFIVTNIEAIGRTMNPVAKKLSGTKFILEAAILDMIKCGDLNIIAIDECHKNMSPKSTQGKVILDIKKQTGKMVQWIPMSGTPIKNKPIDVYTPLKLVDGHEIKNFYQWSQLFCIFGGYGGYEIMGYKNIPMLKDMLQGNMIRRMKSEVLDLPPKIYFNEYVELTSYQEQLYEAIVDDMYEHKAEILESVNPLTAMLRLRQVTGSPELVDDSIAIDDKYLAKNAKLIRLLEILDDCVERNEKAIVFSNWVEPLRTIYKFISKKYKTCCFTGTMSEADREKHKRVFINNPDYKVMIGTMGAMGVSLTLTVATNVIFFDDCWTPADKEQCEDRANRIGSTNSLNVYTLMAKNTIDERVRQILEHKKGIASYIVDDKLDLKKYPELFDLLLGRDK